MGITYNRRPVGVSVPSSNDSKHHFFNHYNWKGINQNRNFLTVDQETFADSNNVYVDDEGVLKSRPPLRYFRGTSEKKIKEIKSFGNIIICTYVDDFGDWFIGIIKDNVLVFNYETISYYPLRVFRNGDYLYIFVSNGVLKYNIDENTIDENSMYIPVTRIYTGSTFEYYDEENLFSTYEKYRYLIHPTNVLSVENVIDVSAQGKYGEYEYYIGTDKISKKIYIDSEGKFLNHLHQPFSGDVTGYEVVNYYGDTVPSSLIQNDMLYRYFDGKLLRASVSDMLFEVLIDDIRLNIP